MKSFIFFVFAVLHVFVTTLNAYGVVACALIREHAAKWDLPNNYGWSIFLMVYFSLGALNSGLSVYRHLDRVFRRQFGLETKVEEEGMLVNLAIFLSEVLFYCIAWAALGRTVEFHTFYDYVTEAEDWAIRVAVDLSTLGVVFWLFATFFRFCVFFFAFLRPRLQSSESSS